MDLKETSQTFRCKICDGERHNKRTCAQRKSSAFPNQDIDV